MTARQRRLAALPASPQGQDHRYSPAMTWTAEAKLDAAIRAPTGRAMLRPDSRVIERPGWHQVITPSAPGTLFNEIVLSQVEPEDADRVIDEVVAMYLAIGHPVKWCVGPWTRPADFGDRLARRGFTSWEIRGMVCETSLTIGRPQDVTVHQVDEATVEPYVALMLRGWSLPPDQAPLEIESHLAALRARPREAHFFAAEVAGTTVGTTGLILRGDYAYLVGAQVLPEFRGRGIYRALVAARLAFLTRHGISLAVTHAREATSAPILDRLGFETVFRSRCYLLAATNPGSSGAGNAG
jgi:GNAT superfamily N-acetyltransferase